MQGDLAFLIAAWFGCGLLPLLPSTWASLTALPIAAAINLHGKSLWIIAVSVVVFGVGLWAAETYSSRSDHPDPPEVVIDEVAGQLLVLSALPLSWRIYALGFVTFRLADTLKPWPAHWIDQNLHGGPGIMLDDIVAAAYAVVASLLIVRLVRPR